MRATPMVQNVDVDLYTSCAITKKQKHQNKEVLRVLPQDKEVLQQNKEKIVNYWPDGLINSIKGILEKPCDQPVKTEFKFALDKESGQKN